MTTAATPLSIYPLRIVLRGISPLMWRRVLVSSATPLAHLQAIVQLLFAWRDEHLHHVRLHGRAYGSSGAPTCGVRLRDLCLHRGERCLYVYDFGAFWECDLRLEAILPLAPRRVYPVCIGGTRAAPPEDCQGAWSYWERLDLDRLYPPLEAMGGVAEAVTTLFEADPQTSVRAALGDLDDLREAVDCLEAYEAFQPEHVDRSAINTQRHARPWPGRGRMQVTSQVVTSTDDGQETPREIACVERQALTPETLGLSLTEGTAVLQALQEVVVEWPLPT